MAMYGSSIWLDDKMDPVHTPGSAKIDWSNGGSEREFQKATGPDSRLDANKRLCLTADVAHGGCSFSPSPIERATVWIVTM